MIPIKEVILGEGKNDTKKVNKIFPNVETIETNGYDITNPKIQLVHLIGFFAEVINSQISGKSTSKLYQQYCTKYIKA